MVGCVRSDRLLVELDSTHLVHPCCVTLETLLKLSAPPFSHWTALSKSLWDVNHSDPNLENRNGSHLIIVFLVGVTVSLFASHAIFRR